MKDISYNELIMIAQEESAISLKDVSSVFKKLISTNNENFEEYSYKNSTRKKLRDLAQMVSDEKWKVFADDDDYHNLAIDYARLNLYDCALWVLERGLKESPSSDLLADKILYGLESGQHKLCEEAYTSLIRLDKESWGWRAYSFTIKYYLKKVKKIPKGKTRDNLKAKTYALAEEFINYARLNPEEAADRAYFEKAALIKELGPNGSGEDNVTQESILNDGCTTINPAPQCALCLASIMLERGNYDEAIFFLSQCKLAVNNPQPSINPAYVYLLYAMAKTSKLLKTAKDGDFSGKESELESIYRDFHTAMDSFSLNTSFKDPANRTIKMLEIQTGVKDTTQSFCEDEFI